MSFNFQSNYKFKIKFKFKNNCFKSKSRLAKFKRIRKKKLFKSIIKSVYRGSTQNEKVKTLTKTKKKTTVRRSSESKGKTFPRQVTAGRTVCPVGEPLRRKGKTAAFRSSGWSSKRRKKRRSSNVGVAEEGKILSK